MVTDLPAHTRERIDEIRATHVPRYRPWWQKLFRRPATCVMCGVRIGMCQQRKWAAAVASGARAPAGWNPRIPQQRMPRSGRAGARPATWWNF